MKKVVSGFILGLLLGFSCFPRTTTIVLAVEVFVIASALIDWSEAKSEHVAFRGRLWLWAHWTVLRRAVSRVVWVATLTVALWKHARRPVSAPVSVAAPAVDLTKHVRAPRPRVVIPIRQEVA